MEICVLFSKGKQYLTIELRCFRRSRGECRGIVYCEYSTGSRIDRKNQRMREVKQVVEWIEILLRWLIATPDRATQVLERGWTFVAAVVVDRPAALWAWRRLVLQSMAQELPHLRSIHWMTYCRGQERISAPPGLSWAFVPRTPQVNCRIAPALIPEVHVWFRS
jgi:hypothetical protein